MALTIRQQRLTFAAYFILSAIATITKYQSLYDTSANYYVLGVRFSQGDAVLVLANMTVATTLLVGTLLQHFVFGELRLIEIEHLYERSWSTIIGILMSSSAYKRNENTMFLVVLFCGLICSKVFHCIMCDRLDALIQQFYQRSDGNIRSIIMNRVVFMLLLFIKIDISLIKSCIDESFVHRSAMLLLISFEMFILVTELVYAGLKFTLDVYEIYYTQKHPEEEIWSTKVWIESIVKAVLDLLKSVMIPTFFVFFLFLETLPFSLLAESFRSFYAFGKSATKIHRLAKNARKLNDALREPTTQEIEDTDICIICRDDLVLGGTGTSRSVPKKLPCGHILHDGCIRSWLQMSNACPTCRKEVITGGVPAQDQTPAPAPAPGPAQAQIQAQIQDPVQVQAQAQPQALIEDAPPVEINANPIENFVNTGLLFPEEENIPAETEEEQESSDVNAHFNERDIGYSGDLNTVNEEERTRYFSVSTNQKDGESIVDSLSGNISHQDEPREELIDEFCDLFRKVDDFKRDLDGIRDQEQDQENDHDYVNARSYVEQHKRGAVRYPALFSVNSLSGNDIADNSYNDDNGHTQLDPPFIFDMPSGSSVPSGWTLLPAKRVYEGSRDEYYIQTGPKRRLRLKVLKNDYECDAYEERLQ
jgi:E3 ubiquitin-protein ligase synoviolin